MGPYDHETWPTNDQGTETTPVELAFHVHHFQCDIQVQGCGTCFIYFPSEPWWTWCICITLYTLYTMHLRTSLGIPLVR